MIELFFTYKTLFIVCAIVYPVFFFIANNSFRYSSLQICISISSIIVFSIFMAFSIAALFYLFPQLMPLNDSIYCLIAMFFIVIGLEDFINLLFKIKRLKKSLIILSPVIGYFIGLWPFFAIILLIFIMSFIDIAKNINKKNDIDFSFKKENESSLFFKNTPNIYFVLLESYQNNKTISDIYKFDNSDIENFLKQRGFEIFDNIIANYTDTLSTLLCLMTMKHHFYKASTGNQDVISAAREVYLGIRPNPVFTVLKNNDYKIHFYDDGDYISGNLIKSSAFDTSNITPYTSPALLLAPLFSVSTRIRALSIEKHTSKLLPGLENPIDAYMHYFKPSEHPKQNLIFFHFGAGHTVSTDSWEILADWEEHYCKLLKKANIELERLINIIDINDPSALVILCGDHGACRFRNIFYGPADCVTNITSCGISPELVARDYFSIFFAARWHGHNITIPESMSHVNLFRYIFNWLTGDSNYISSLENNDAFIWHRFTKAVKVYDNGKLLSAWLPYENERYRR